LAFLIVSSDFLSEFIRTMSENESQPITSQVFHPSAQVVIEAFEQGALVLRLADQHLIELNPIASTILAKSDGQHSVAQIAAALAETYEIPETELRQDAISLYKQLLTQRIVEPAVLIDKNGLLIEPFHSDESLYVQNPDMRQHLDEESGALFNPDTSQIKYVNCTGLSCWKLCDGAHDVAAITAELQQSMKEVPTDTLVADVREFISDLLKADFIRAISPAQGRRQKMSFNSSDGKA
jgi:hypothetical protein